MPNGQQQDPVTTVPGLSQLGQAYKNTTDYLKEVMPGGIGGVLPKISKNVNRLFDYTDTIKNIQQNATVKPAGGEELTQTLKAGGQTLARKAKAAFNITEPSKADWDKAIITDKQRTEGENRQLGAQGNPLQASGFEARSQAIGGFMQALENTPEYQQLAPKDRVAFRNRYVYDRYVVPTYQEAGMTPISRKEWLMNSRYDAALKGSQDVIGGAVKGTQKIALAGAKFEQADWALLHGMKDYFSGDTAFDFAASMKKGDYEASHGVWGKAVNSLQAGLNDTNFFINSRPRDSLLSSAAVWGGEQLAQLPIYMAVGAGTGAVAEGLGLDIAAKGGGGLTGMLSASSIGKFAGRRLMAAADGYLSSRAVGDTNKEAIEGGVGFAVLGAAGEGLKAGWKTAIKKFSGEVIAMGGQPFGEKLTESAIAELNGKVATIKLNKRAAEDPINHISHEAEKKAINDISRFKYGKQFKDLSKAEQQEVAAARVRFYHEAATELPVHVPDLMKNEAENEIQQQVQQSQMFGKYAGELKQAGVDVAQVVADGRINTAAAQTGLHNPEAAAARVAEVESAAASEAEKPVEKAVEKPEETYYEKRHREFVEGKARKQAAIEEYERARKAGGQVAPETSAMSRDEYNEQLHQEYLDQKARKEKAIRDYDISRRSPEEPPPSKPEETPTESTPTPKEASPTPAEASTNGHHAEDYEPSEGEGVSVGADEYITPQEYDNHIDDVRAFYRNKSERLDSKGRIIGARDQRTVGQRMRAKNRAEFVELLRDIDKDFVPFENDVHRMYWHKALFAKDMTPSMRAKLTRQIKAAAREEGQAEDAKTIMQRAIRAVRHGRDLIETGKIKKGGAFWNSTRLSGWTTKWMRQLRKERKDMPVKKVRRIVKGHKGAQQTLDGIENFLEDQGLE